MFVCVCVCLSVCLCVCVCVCVCVNLCLCLTQQLHADEVIPADMLLLHTSHEDGICFVETANLDGETNLKQRRLFFEVPWDGVLGMGAGQFRSQSH